MMQQGLGDQATLVLYGHGNKHDRRKEMASNPVIDEIYQTKTVRDASGNEYRLTAEISPAEGNYLYRLISADDSVSKTLEVGCAFGLSSLHICEALRDRPNPSHVIVDPGQMGDWHGVGLANLRRAGIDFFSLISEPSEFALPELARSQAGSFDLVFIDGWHTFDHTMLDLFYANLLVRVGGYVVVDDGTWRSVSAAISYFGNYPAYQEIRDPRIPAHSFLELTSKAISTTLRPSLASLVLPARLYDRYYRRVCFPSMVGFKKVAEDARNWDWYEGF
jgi:predicted O-methyltransferase YrrM